MHILHLMNIMTDLICKLLDRVEERDENEEFKMKMCIKWIRATVSSDLPRVMALEFGLYSTLNKVI